MSGFFFRRVSLNVVKFVTEYSYFENLLLFETVHKYVTEERDIIKEMGFGEFLYSLLRFIL